jgi:hypothetical protein
MTTKPSLKRLEALAETSWFADGHPELNEIEEALPYLLDIARAAMAFHVADNEAMTKAEHDEAWSALRAALSELED